MNANQAMACPVCHSELSIAQFFASEEAQRTFTRLAVLSIPLGARVVRYLTLFSPPKTRLTHGKQLKLIEQLLPDLERRAITQQGQDWQAPLSVWNQAFEKVFAVADSGRLTLPLSGHGYLYSTIRDLSNKAAAQAEGKTEQDRRNTPQRGSLQVDGGPASIGALVGKDPALAAIDECTRNATKPDPATAARIASILGKPL